MQSATKRVRTIYSVIASSNRLEILRILNSKGPLSYSELKTLSGFKSKKESGKFAYHLRKLVRQMLVSLNRSERRYTVTSLGRLILNLTRQIEEQSVIESGKLFVRTSRQMMEEFNPDMILQSLVREAGMPVELAQKITSEAESRLYKFQTTYLTAPLIREMVNALLIEHGYEEYRHRLTRLGLPVYDITEMMNKIARGSEGVDSLVSQTSRAVFSEYLLLKQLPRDVSDAHLAGDIHLSNLGAWGLKPDTVFVDLTSMPSSGINFDGKLLESPRLALPTKITNALSSTVMISSLLRGEVSREITLGHFLGYISRYVDSRSNQELIDLMFQTFKMMSQYSAVHSNRPVISLHLSTNPDDDIDAAKVTKARKAILDAYYEYISSVPIPTIRLIGAINPKRFDEQEFGKIASIIHQGGCVAISRGDDSSNAFSGIRRSIVGEGNSGGLSILHSLAVNLPRLAYESNQDDTYFRAKLALLLQIATRALSARRVIMEDITRNGLLPMLSKNSGILSTEMIPLIINLTGLKEAIETLVGSKPSHKDRITMTEKIMDTALKITSEAGDESGDVFRISAVPDDSGVRLANLDADKYGKSTVPMNARKDGYSQAPIIVSNDLLSEDIMKELTLYSDSLNGGCATTLGVDGLTVAKISEISRLANRRLDFFKYQLVTSICKGCGSRSTGVISKCDECSSTSIISNHIL